MRVIGIITTKNRTNLFEKAIESAINQTRKLDDLIVVSDSTPENYQVEMSICRQYDVKLLIDEFTSNYAGSLNTALTYIVNNEKQEKLALDEIYIACLDDDDTWDRSYIEACVNACKSDTDFVVTGLNYINEEGTKQLSIPNILTINDFLKGNPHIQGSNTFVKLTTLLKAGVFDENMSSTTDRDLFTRIMMLNPKYEVVQKHLVDVNAFNNRERITNGIEKKTEGLAKFYYKYQGLMSDEIKESFFSRALNYFGVDKEQVIDYHINSKVTTCIPDWKRDKYSGKLVIGFIATEYELGLRLLKQLVDLKRPNTKVVILKNFEQSTFEYLYTLKNSEYDHIDYY